MRTALITGGASGIGEALARRLAALGDDVVIADLDQGRGEALAGELGARFMRVDVTSEDEVEAAVAFASGASGRLDIMVNNAGIIGSVGSILEISAADWSRTLAVLLDSVFFGIKHAGRLMAVQRSGVILSTASAAALSGGLGPHAYSTAKRGVVALTQSAAAELAAKGIRVNALAPGVTVTPMIAHLNGGDAQAEADSAARSALGTAIMPDEIAAMMVYLASEDARHITGQVIAIDSGLATFGTEVPRYHQVSPPVFRGGSL